MELLNPRIRTIASSSLILNLLACQEPLPPAESLVLDADSIHVAKSVERLPINAKVFDAYGRPISVPGFRWNSSEPNLVQIDQNGLVTAGEYAGSSDITVSFGGLSSVARITVLSEADALLDRLPTLNIRLMLPREMGLGQNALVRVQASRDPFPPLEEDTSNLTVHSAQTVAGRILAIRLNGSDGLISAPVEPEAQLVSARPMQWSWIVTATEVGEQLLAFPFRTMGEIESGPQETITYVAHGSITVVDPWAHRFGRFILRDWSKLVGLILLPIIGWIARGVRDRKKKPEPLISLP